MNLQALTIAALFVIFGDARAMIALDDNDGIMGVWPVRAGITWPF